MSLQLTDIAIFLISFAACVYCIVLSRRLAKLQNTKDGLGATIVACSNSISSMSTAAKGTTTHARQLADELSTLMKQAELICQKIEKTTTELEQKTKIAVAHSKQERASLNEHMQNVLNLNKKHIQDVTALTRQLRSTVPSGPHTDRFKSIATDSPLRRQAE